MFLSGVEPTKVLLARWLHSNSKVMIFDEPTRGIDVGAKADVFALMSRLAEGGTGIIMISSEMPEILAMADRILVMRGGQPVSRISAGRNPGRSFTQCKRSWMETVVCRKT